MPTDLLEPPMHAAEPRSVIPSNVRTDVLILGTFCLVLFFLGLGSYGLMDPGDGYFTEAAREMLESGDYVVPHLNYQIYFSKPILIYWLIGGAYKIFGISEFSSRIWSAIITSAVVMAVYFTGRRVSGRKAGLIAAVMFGSSPLVVTFARMALVDALFSGLLGLALCATILTLCTDSKKSWPFIYVALGLAILAKGPAAVVLFAAAMLLNIFLSGAAWREQLARLHPFKGAAIALGIATPWYLAVSAATNGLWTNVFFFYENVARFEGHANHRNLNWWFYLPVIGYGFFPWSLLIPAAVIDVTQELLKPRKPGKQAPYVILSLPKTPQQQARILLFSWTICILFAFSLSSTKLDTYILPLFPAIALTTGLWLERSLTEGRTGALRGFSTALGLFGVFFLVLSVAAAAIALAPQLLPATIAPVLERIDPLLKWSVILGVATSSALFIAQRQLMRADRSREALIVLFLGTVFCCGYGAGLTFKTAYEYRQEDLHNAIRSIGDKPGAVAIYQEFKPTVIFYLRRPVDSFFRPEMIGPAAQTNPQLAAAGLPQFIIATRAGALELMKQRHKGLQVMDKRGDWYVFCSENLAVRRLPTLKQSFEQQINLGAPGLPWGTLPYAGGSKPFTE